MMAEYALPPHMLSQHHSARERTALWVSDYTPQAMYSPSYPPTPVEGYNGPPSPAVSTHSLPPKMILRYNDGRGDVPIPNLKEHSRQDARHRGHHTSSHSSSPLSARPHDGPPPSAPEQIRVLPSRPINNSSSTSSSRQSQPRSKSIPRNHASIPSQDVPPVPHSRPSPTVPYSPWVHPTPSPNHHSRHASAAAAYPTAHGRPQYDPRHYQHPHRVGPDGMIYSHSAPPVVGGPSHYPPQHPGMYPSPVHGDERIGRGRDREASSRAYSRRRPMNPNRDTSSDSLESDETEDTFYMSSSGQKVHVIAHSPERSDGTGSSTTKVGSPWSQTSAKKPFFSRIFGLGGHKAPSPTSSKGSQPHPRKLHRRHSIGDEHRPVIVGRH